MNRTLAIAVSLTMISQAAAQQVCGPRKDIIDGLNKVYGETVRFEGVNKAGEYLEIFGNEKNGTFTLIATRPGGITCILDAGIGNHRKNFDYGPQLDH